MNFITNNYVESSLAVAGIIDVTVRIRLEDGTIHRLSIADGVKAGVLTNGATTPFVLEQQPALQVAPQIESKKPIPAPATANNSRPMTPAEMLSALKTAGYNKRGLHLCKPETLSALMAEKGLAPYVGGVVPAPQGKPQGNPAPQGKPKGRPKGKSNMETALLERSALKPIQVYKASKPDEAEDAPRTVFPNGTTVKELFYTDDSVEENGVKVFSPHKDQSGVADGFIKCVTWFVKDENVIEW